MEHQVGTANGAAPAKPWDHGASSGQDAAGRRSCGRWRGASSWWLTASRDRPGVPGGRLRRCDDRRRGPKRGRGACAGLCSGGSQRPPWERSRTLFDGNGSARWCGGDSGAERGSDGHRDRSPRRNDDVVCVTGPLCPDPCRIETSHLQGDKALRLIRRIGISPTVHDQFQFQVSEGHHVDRRYLALACGATTTPRPAPLHLFGGLRRSGGGARKA